MKQSPKMSADKRQAQLIKAAHKIITKKGYQTATMDEIARAARLTKGALYFHFKSKEDLFLEVVRDYWKNMTEPIYQLVENADSMEDFLEKSIRYMFELVEKERYFSIAFWQQSFKITRIRNYWISEHERLMTAISKYIEKNSSLSLDESYSFVNILGALMDGMIVRQQMCKDCVNIPQMADEIINLSYLYLQKNERTRK